MSDTAHQEKHLEAYVVSRLKAQGWQVGDTRNYDAGRALCPDDLIAWLEATQPETWARLQKNNAERPREALMDRLVKALEQHGTIHVIRRGFSIAGCGHIDLTEAAPEDKRNDTVLKRYAANILRVVPQLEYHPTRKLAIDLVLFINGIPVATVELKPGFTQSAEAAMEQYKTDRLPYDPKTRRREPLLTFKRGAVVHFAMSDSDIRMTTRLDGGNTVFLPFNQGHKGHAGNPPREDKEYPVACFRESVCQRDAWRRIFHSFVYIGKKDVVDLHGNWKKKETLIFPRYHQWESVNAMIEDSRAHGPGMQHLADQSAGSGKTSTISWLAHDLVKLRRDNGEPIFNSVIIVTDRNVLDSQLRDAVRQIDHQFGVIAAIDRQKSSKPKSRQLAEALPANTPIIVVTIQTFSLRDGSHRHGGVAQGQKLRRHHRRGARLANGNDGRQAPDGAFHKRQGRDVHPDRGRTAGAVAEIARPAEEHQLLRLHRHAEAFHPHAVRSPGRSVPPGIQDQPAAAVPPVSHAPGH